MSPAPLAISCGEPAGIGPEIAAKAWQALRAELPMLWIGDPRHLPAGTPLVEIARPEDALAAAAGGLPVLARDFGPPAVPGHPDPAHAPHVIDAIAEATALARRGTAAGVVTAPIHKKALIDGAAFAYPGHTEYLAALAGDVPVVMMLASPQLRVVPATVHIPLEEVPNALTPALLAQVLDITHYGLRAQFGIAAPRIAVAGLNPHAGEGGAMGRQEIDWIAGVVEDQAARGRQVTGPWPADTLFHAAARARFDAAVAMYHDQALIPIKTLDFDRGVNVTLGLPFVRCSPDHGTAFDIAGTGRANPTSMIEACRLAWRLAAA